ncbi:MAG: exodeoxyribonuclease VII large subunit [Bacteroidales bacterium]|nr:exodeoxyribonuclease VII large subunit [Bacteroidales bacterium]
MSSEATASIRLSELNQAIRSLVNQQFPDQVWVMADISEIKTNASGHAYLELIEKDPKTEKIIAKARATIWSFSYHMLKPFFETSTGYKLEAGIKILVKVSVEFHEVYGFSLNITDIDPTYTLGDIEKKRQEIISRLEKEGVFQMNKETSLPLVPQKIAVISSKTAAGFEDFMNQLNNNEYGYVFYPVLFAAIMQGDQTEDSIIRAMDQVFDHEDFFDVVVIIRGGGSKSDLAAFDNYNIAYHITQFPVPVITGIGHEQDETIADLVAHTRLKTPTAVAEFLIGRAEAFEGELIEKKNELLKTVTALLSGYDNQLRLLSRALSGNIQQTIQRQSDYLVYVSDRLSASSDRSIRDQKRTIRILLNNLTGEINNSIRLQSMQRSNLEQKFVSSYSRYLSTIKQHLSLLKQRIHDMDPGRILERGYSITLHSGKAVKDISVLHEGDILETRITNGSISSRVMNTKLKD